MKINFVNVLFAVAVFAFVSLTGASSLYAQESSQKEAASRSAKFATVAKTDMLYKGALDAHDKDGGAKLVGKQGSIRGKVAKIYAPRGGKVVILNFDRDYKSALTAVLRKEDFSKFPDLEQLEGKEVVVSGKFVEFKDSPEITLNDPKQISIVK